LTVRKKAVKLQIRGFLKNNKAKKNTGGYTGGYK
jgi:hypothetical protein